MGIGTHCANGTGINVYTHQSLETVGCDCADLQCCRTVPVRLYNVVAEAGKYGTAPSWFDSRCVLCTYAHCPERHALL